MAYIPHGGLGYAKGRQGRSQAPYAQAGVQIGRVIAVYRDNYTVDLAMGTGEIWRRIHVATSAMGTRTGKVYLPTPSNQTTDVTRDGPLGNFNDDGNRSLYAVVGFVNEDPNHPLVIGFLHPRTSQMQFNRAGFQLERHESDMYTMIENGPSSTYDAATDTTIPNYEWVHSSGLYLRVGQGTTHEDLTGQDVDGNAKFRGTANANGASPGTAGPTSADFVPVTVQHPSGSAVQMDTLGNIKMTAGPAGSVQAGGNRVLTTSDKAVASGVATLDANSHVLQQAVFDATEASTNDTLGSTSIIVNNLNRIRNQLGVVIGGVGSAWHTAVQMIPLSQKSAASGVVGLSSNSMPQLRNGGTPTVTANGGLGTAPSVTLQAGSTDAAGVINFIVGTGPSGGAQFTLNFSTTLAAAPKVVLNSLQGANTGSSLTVSSISATSIVFSDAPLTAGASFGMAYLIIP